MSTQPPASQPLERFGQILGTPDFTWSRVEGIRARRSPAARKAKRVLDGIVVERVVFEADEPEEVPCLLLYPAGVRIAALPLVLALHQTTEPADLGKAEPAGLAGDRGLAYALELARKGAVVLAPDYPLFGQYQPDIDRIYEEWGYASVSQKGLVNHILALDALQEITGRYNPVIGVIGHSLGGSNALFLAAHDPRIAACVCSAGYSSFSSYARHHPMGLAGWALREKYMPRIADEFETRVNRLPSDFDDVLAAIAPCPLFISAPTHDDTFECASARVLAEAATPLWPGGDLVLKTPDADHSFPDAERRAAYDFLLGRLI